MASGDALSGRIASCDRDAMHIIPLAEPAQQRGIDIPISALAKIEFRGGRQAWVGDLRPTAVSQIPYFDRIMPYRVDQSLTGGPLVLADGPIAKGIAVHSKCVLTYDIDGAFERFRCKIGFQQPEGRFGRAVARVIGDDKVLWRESDLAGDAKPTPLDLKVSGVKTLTLEVDFGKYPDVGGRVIWGEARLVKKKVR
jgi:hypothetical protein